MLVAIIVSVVGNELKSISKSSEFHIILEIHPIANESRQMYLNCSPPILCSLFSGKCIKNSRSLQRDQDKSATFIHLISHFLRYLCAPKNRRGKYREKLQRLYSDFVVLGKQDHNLLLTDSLVIGIHAYGAGRLGLGYQHYYEKIRISIGSRIEWILILTLPLTFTSPSSSFLICDVWVATVTTHGLTLKPK